MNDDWSTQFPGPPELQPLSSAPTRGQQIFSFVLIIVGLVLLTTGGWMFYQYQHEANQPLPARMIEVSAADLTPSPTPSASPTKIQPTPTNKLENTITPTRPFTVESTATPTPTHPVNTSTPTRPPASPTPAATDTPVPTFTVTTDRSLESNPLVVAAPENTSPLPAASEETSMESPITRIVAESIGLDSKVIAVGWQQQMRQGVPVNIWVVADYVAGWHKNSALPGQGGNIVLSGHHNIKGEVFRHTIELNLGDIVTLYEGDNPYRYTVVDKFIVKDKGEPDAVRRENAKWIGPFNEERLTLVTCWPYTNNTHRAIVIAKPVPN